MSGNGNGDTADLTIRLLRELRDKMDGMSRRIDGMGRTVTAIQETMATKRDLAKVRKELGERIDVLGRAVKDNHRRLHDDQCGSTSPAPSAPRPPAA